MAIKKVQKFMFKDQSTCTSWDAPDVSDVNKVLEDEKKDLLTKYQELLKRNAEMETKSK